MGGLLSKSCSLELSRSDQLLMRCASACVTEEYSDDDLPHPATVTLIFHFEGSHVYSPCIRGAESGASIQSEEHHSGATSS